MKKNHPSSRSIVPILLKSPIDSIIWGILCLLVGVVFILYPMYYNMPVQREDAVLYEGCFEGYDRKIAESEKINGIYLSDGTTLNIYHYNLNSKSKAQLEAFPKGSKVYALVNPNNNHVVELKIEDRELMNFESSQQEVAKYNKFYVYMGAFTVAGGVSMIVYGFWCHFHIKSKKSK